MDRFRVWVRPLGANCRVRVDGIANTQWLLDRLGQSFVFKSSEPVREDPSSSLCTFEVMYSSQIPRRVFEKLLQAIPQVEMMTDPA